MITPFRLAPIYKDYVWGGKRLRSTAEVTAEAWIVSEGDVVLDGIHAGKTLGQVCELESDSLLGTKVIAQSGKRFPLLIKLLDCAAWLSLQVHPNNEQAERLEGTNHFGKTEAWYVIDAEEGAELISGFRPEVTSEDIQKAVGKKDLLDLVERRRVRAGDAIFIAPGTIHALGAGLLIYEVQQNSDITYRVYDWDRPLSGGRKLHIEESIAVLNPDEKGRVIRFDPKEPPSSRKVLVSCEFFTLELLRGGEQAIEIDTQKKSFSVLTCITGGLKVNGKDWSFKLNALETLFIPAECGGYYVDLPDKTTALLSHSI
jgi:mannose-6-phosphate isomerase